MQSAQRDIIFEKLVREVVINAWSGECVCFSTERNFLGVGKLANEVKFGK